MGSRFLMKRDAKGVLLLHPYSVMFCFNADILISSVKLLTQDERKRLMARTAPLFMRICHEHTTSHPALQAAALQVCICVRACVRVRACVYVCACVCMIIISPY